MGHRNLWLTVTPNPAWNAENLSAGVYVVKAAAGNKNFCKKAVVLP